MKTVRTAMLATLLLTACDFDVPDLNRPALESLEKNPTPSAAQAVATGLLIGARRGVTDRVGLVSEWGILGRESLVLTSSDPRFINELLQGPLDPGSGNFGGNFWVIPYANIRGANLLLHALDNPVLVGFTNEQKETMRGFAKTMQALDFLQIVGAHDTNGAVLDVDRPRGEIAPIVTDMNQIYTFIENLLDDAQGRLAAAPATATFAFPLATGFTGFDTPATFLKFNRALRARVAAYHGKYADALTALGASFLDTTKPLSLGAYHAYGAASGDNPNVLNANDIYVHPSTVTDVETGDLRAAKWKTASTPGVAGTPPHSSNYAFTLYPDSTSPIPIIRNEELILLRAEANCAPSPVPPNTCTGSGLGAAIADVNFIRQNSGGLAQNSGLNPGNFVDELLKQRRYSLLFEGGHRWIDLRRFGRLDPSHVVVDTGDVVQARFPIPLTETQAR